MNIVNRIGRCLLLGSCAALIAAQLNASAANLVHRYSFDDDGTGTNIVDSVGGPDWNGIMPNGGDLFSSPGQVTLLATGPNYVQFPSGILSNYTALTIDIWATLGSLPNDCFLWDFGFTDTNVLSGGQPSGAYCIFMQPRNGQLAISGTSPSWQATQTTGGAGDLSFQTVHITGVYNPPAGYMALYKNGELVSQNTGLTVQLSSISNVVNYIARSLYDADAYIDVMVDEYRIWDGALNSLEVAGCEVAGPNTVGSAADAGTVTGITVQVPFFQLTQGGQMTAAVMAQASNLGYQVEIGRLCTFTSGNENVITVDGSGRVTAVGEGSTTLTAQYGDVSNAVVITVVQPASILVHRYSFNDAPGSLMAEDSVSGATWNGNLPAGGTFTGTELQLDAASQQYVQLPADILSDYAAVTIDAWATFPTTLPGTGWFWGIGDTGSTGAGKNYIYAQPSGGIIAITGADPGWSGPEQTANGFGNLSLKTNVHLTAVFNPTAGWIAVYTNGVLKGKHTAVTWQLTDVTDVFAYIGKSLYNNDPYISVNLDEFRMYNGALTSQGIAIADLAGPDATPSGITNGPGELVSLTLQGPTTLEWKQVGSVKLLANYTDLENFDLAGNSVFPPAGLSITSSDTNVIAYTNGIVTAVNPGSSTITANYQGITKEVTITVVHAPTPTLAHRYSFSETSGATVADSINPSGEWDGTLPNGGTFADGKLALDSTLQQHVQLPAGILSNYANVTIEAWASFGTLPVNSCFFSFGDVNEGGVGRYYLFASPQVGRICIGGGDPGWQFEQAPAAVGNWSGRTDLHITAVYNPTAHYIALYTNGVLGSINTAETYPLSVVSNMFSYIGKSLYTADPYGNYTLDEFRIYNGALSPDEVSATETLGPDQVLNPVQSVTLKVSVANGNVTLSWPADATGFKLETRSSLTSGDWTEISDPAAQQVDDEWRVTVPKSGDSQFFRIVK
ncbi:MAG TPA: LamG-like jellyroll fold domain-containing protein [Verrucomicrobiae bacterium]|nr:LamG-like jellyroll fold domain-containing protein [Verrucomicrobiae bacterium]